MPIDPQDIADDIKTNVEADTGNTMVAPAEIVWLAVSKALVPYFTGGGAVTTVTAGSAMVTCSPTTGDVIVDVVPANFTGIPQGGVTGLVSDLATITSDISSLSSAVSALPTGSGTANTVAKWTSSSALGNSSITDNGTTFAINTNKFTVTEASGNTLVAGTLDATGDFAVNTNKFTVAASSGNTVVAGTLALTPMTAGSVLFAATSGVVTQDNSNLFWDNTAKRLGIGTAAAPSVPLHTVGAIASTGASAGLYVGATGITRTGVTGFTETNVEFTKDSANTFIVSAYGNAGSDVPSLQAFRARGTAAASSAVQSGDVIGSVGFTGATSATAHHSGAYIQATATENWVTGTNVGTKLEFTTSQNATSALLGRAVRMTIAHNGAVSVVAQGSATDVISPQHTGTNLTNNTAMFSAVSTMSFDTTGGGLNSYILYADCSTTRSAGGSSLSNIAGRFRARNAQVNVAIRTDEGNVTLNVINGITAIGPSFTTDPNAQLHVRVSASGATAAAAGSTIVSEVNGVSYITIKGPASTEKGVLFSNTNAANDGAILYDNSGFARGLQLRAAGTNFLTISSAGAIVIGSATTQSHTVNGRVALTSTTATANADASTFSPVAGTTNNLSAFVATNNGTFNTTSGALSEFAIRAISSSTRSSGANNLTNVAGYFDATGAQVNVALQTASGSNYLNVTAGSTGIGYALGAALPSTLSVTGSGTFTTTLDVTGNFNVNTNKFSVVAASGNTTVAGTLGVTGDVAVNTNKFTVTASSGNTLVAGVLTVGATATIRSGTGSPETVVTAPVGSIFLRTDGGAITTLYVKESGAGNTGWVAK